MRCRSVTTVVAAAAVAGVAFAMAPAPANAASTRTAVVTAQDPLATAVAAADRAVLGGVNNLASGSNDTFERSMVTPWVKDLYSVAYERTYLGLPVVGGDAVVLPVPSLVIFTPS